MHQPHNSTFTRNALGIIQTRFAHIILAIVPSILVARELGPTMLGDLNYLLVIVAILSVALRLGIGPALTHFIGRKQLAPEFALAQSTSYSIVAGSLGVLVIIAIRICEDRILPGESPSIGIIAAAALLPFNLALAFGRNVFLGTTDIPSRNKLELLEVFVYALMIVVSYFALNIDPVLVLGIMLASKIAAYLYLHLQTRPHRLSEYKPRIETIRRLIGFGIAPFATAVLLLLAYRVDVFFVKHMRSAEELGLYTIAVSNAERLLLIPAALASATLSRSSNLTQEEGAAATAVLCRVVILVFPMLLVISGLVLAFLIPVLYGDAYRNSVLPLLLLLPGILALGVFQVMHSHLVANGYAARSARVILLAILLNIALNILAIPRYGANGAAVTSSISYMLSAIMIMFTFSSATGTELSSIALPGSRDARYLAARVMALARPGTSEAKQ